MQASCQPWIPTYTYMSTVWRQHMVQFLFDLGMKAEWEQEHGRDAVWVYWAFDVSRRNERSALQAADHR